MTSMKRKRIWPTRRTHKLSEECAQLAKKLDALKRRGTRKTYKTTNSVRRHLDRLARH